MPNVIVDALPSEISNVIVEVVRVAEQPSAPILTPIDAQVTITPQDTGVALQSPAQPEIKKSVIEQIMTVTDFQPVLAVNNGNAIQSPNSIISLTAGEAIGYPRVVMLAGGSVYLFDPIANAAQSVVGITLHSATFGLPVQVQTSGELFYNGWGLTPGVTYYANDFGVVTDTPPVLGIWQPLGIAIDSDTLSLNIKNTIDIV